MKRYFIAECDEDGEADAETIFEIDLDDVKGEILKDVKSFMAGFKSVSNKRVGSVTDDLCEIVEKNFKKLEE
ncbi:hypothetical protein CMO96_00325 [Candidatus Woesebacteria bacterium]|nr:hypothetical protein [Candidatus Woesebacteria bacterium]|tara:strand:+ start:283 stop:498 length:216 start_codon:yes stop_codon:yes gene_type:complete